VEDIGVPGHTYADVIPRSLGNFVQPDYHNEPERAAKYGDLRNLFICLKAFQSLKIPMTAMINPVYRPLKRFKRFTTGM